MSDILSLGFHLLQFLVSIETKSFVVTYIHSASIFWKIPRIRRPSPDNMKNQENSENIREGSRGTLKKKVLGTIYKSLKLKFYGIYN